ncbi:MAG: hypothetical protein K8I00_00580, partial [Candidatus Omnitrophica bacterium]|nr:hypothetical protein [Candidatus Omnitrophota bacterium]
LLPPTLDMTKMMRKLTVLLMVCFPLQMINPANVAAESAFVADADLARYVREADLIIEGGVDDINREVAKTVPNYVGQGRQQILLDFGTVAVINFAIANTLKGPAKDGKRVRVYAKPDFTGSFNTLLPNRRYVLFLKKHRFKPGYEVMDKGRMEWTVFDYEGALKVKSGSQLPQYRAVDQYMDYADLIQQISAHLSQAGDSK